MIRAVIFCLLIFSATASLARSSIVVGSKPFTENYILAEILARSLEEKGVEVKRQFGLGGTGIVFRALKAKEIDFYVDYSGTLAEELLKRPDLSNEADIREELEKLGLTISSSLGFSNNYAIGIRRKYAAVHLLEKISDLRAVPAIRAVMNNEFMGRRDGLLAMSRAYGIDFSDVAVMEHALAYEAIAAEKADMTVVYTTDAKIEKLGIKLLEDDGGFFPKYYAVILTRKDFVKKHPQLWEQLRSFEGKISEDQMIKLNGLVELKGLTYAAAAAQFLGLKTNNKSGLSQFWRKMLRRSGEHIVLVLVSLIAAIVLAIPLGVLATQSAKLGQFLLLVTGLLQTIPSLALLCLLIPLFGTGTAPALVALFLYGLLPIVRNTYSGIISIDHEVDMAAEALNLTTWQKVTRVQLPLASVSITSGIKTAAVINVGTTTIAALIGAGGYGAYIVEGLTRNDMKTILLGAVPAAILATVMHYFFELMDRIVIPRGLRL